MMASYFRNLFGSSSGRRKSESRDKAHPSSASVSAIPAQTLSHVYAEPGTVPPTAIPSVRERSNSNVAAHAITPSPLRNTSYDLGLIRERNRPNSSQQQKSNHGSYSRHHRGSSDPVASQTSLYQQAPLVRPPMYRSTSHKGPEHPPLYPLYTPSNSFSSVYTTSSSASKDYFSTSQRPVLPPRSNSNSSVANSENRGEPKPALKRSSTWSRGNSKNSGNRAHVSFLNPNKPLTLHLHPLLAYSRLHRPPICFDVTNPPSTCTVLDKGTLNPVPSHTLTQPATEPPTYTRLVLRCDKLPWPVVVTSQSENTATGRKFYIGSSSSSSSHSRRSSGPAITNLDILFALHSTLSARVTSTEWEALGQGSRAQRKATHAYEKRCQQMGGGWDRGVRRLDYLGQKKILIGIELDKTSNDNGGTGKLIFGK